MCDQCAGDGVLLDAHVFLHRRAAGCVAHARSRWRRRTRTHLIACAFFKMARTFLCHIRVLSMDELKRRILKEIAEFNATPVVFRWNKVDLGVA